jgi:2-polyprenyl-3-methyl-5-hydroxy-6-metoxy-1,4-benzoquinol methylase
MKHVAPTYDGSELSLFAEARHWKRYFSRSLQPFIGPAVLEVGAGIGGTTQVLCEKRHRRWVCLEPDGILAHQIDERIRLGVLPPFCERRVGKLNNVPRDEAFDTIFYIDVLEHIDRDREELEMATEYLNLGGYLVVVAPAHQWLFSPFDTAVGHFRRYSSQSLLSRGPPGTRVVLARYLDSVGLLASLANRVFLRSALPSAAQIRLWDSYMVPCSRLLDPVLRYSFGKTIVLVWERL